MLESANNFFRQIIKRAWFGILFVFLDLGDVYDRFIKNLLPEGWENITLPNGLGYIICFIIVLWAAFMAYHNLRKKRIAEYLEYAPELRKDKTFKIFYDLHKDGDFLKNANTARRQEWDAEILIQMQKYCVPGFRANYLMKTGRRHDKVSSLQDEYYDKAVSEIKDYLDNMFKYYTK